MIKWAFVVVSLLVSSGLFAASISPGTAFNQGASMGQATPAPTIDNTTATQVLPSSYYNGVPTSAQGLDSAGLYGGGLGDLVTPGTSNNTNCMAMTGNANASQQIPCDAVKTINMSDKSGFVFSKSDPMLTGAKSIQSNPQAVMNSAGMQFNVSSFGCTAGTSSVATDSTIQTCSVYSTASSGTCQPFMDVQIQHYVNYQCSQDVDPQQNLTCDTTTTAQINYTCAAGTLNTTTNQCEYSSITSVTADCSSWGYAYYTCPVTNARHITGDTCCNAIYSGGVAPAYGSNYGIASYTAIWTNGGLRANFTVTGLFCDSTYNYDATSDKCVKPATPVPTAVVVNGCATLQQLAQ